MLEVSVCRLQIHDLEMKVHLGCLPAEREIAQPVFFHLDFDFESAPKGCQTDEIDDSICYARVSQRIADYVSSKEFKLIESLAKETYDLVREHFLSSKQKLKVRVHKAFPPIGIPNKGTSFIYGDFL